MILKSITNCGDDKQIVKITENTTTTINDKCEVFSYTCADVKTYNQATVSFRYLLIGNKLSFDNRFGKFYVGCCNNEKKQYGDFQRN